MKGIDVSYCQTGVDYKKVKASGIGAVIIRAGYGREVSQKDTQFEKHYAGAKAVGLKIGAYWFSYAESVSDAVTEAKACLACIKGKKFDMPIYFDMEVSWQTKLGKKTLTAMCKAFCDTIEQAGYKSGSYANPNWYSNYLDYSGLRAKYSIWLAQWASTHSLGCDVWQYSDQGKVNGISGNVDLDVVENVAVITSSGVIVTTTEKATGITEAQLRQKVANQANAWLNAVEGDSLHAKILSIYNNNTTGYKMQTHDAWCCAFVSAVWIVLDIAKYICTDVNCGEIKDKAILKNYWIENDAYVPKVGDAIIYYWSDDGRGDCDWGADHIGIVVAVNGNTFTVTEGNMSGRAGQRHMNVDGRYIRGYIAPDYAAIAKKVGDSIKADSPTVTPTNTPTKEMTTVLNVNYLGVDYTNIAAQVKTVQRLLNAFSCKGKDGKTLTVDGVFGTNTEYAVKTFQKKKNASADGIVGPVTWKLLTGAK